MNAPTRAEFLAERMTASPQAIAAVRAIKHAREWGAYATGRYLDRHNAFDHYVAAVRFETKRKTRRASL